MTRNVGSGVGGEKQRHFRDFLRRAKTPEWRAPFDDALVQRTAGDEIIDERSTDVARANRVDANVVLCPLDGQCLAKRHHRSLRRAVCSPTSRGHQPEHRRRAQDHATALPDHSPRCGLRAIEHARKVDVDRLSPLLGGDVQRGLVHRNSRVVQQDVNSAEPFNRRGDGPLHSAVIGNRSHAHLDLRCRELRLQRILCLAQGGLVNVEQHQSRPMADKRV